MLILKIPSGYLTTNQSEGRADHAPTLSLCLAFKTPSRKAFGEFGSFEHELPILLAWPHVGCLGTNAALPFTTTRWQQIDFTACSQADPSLVR